MRVFSICLLMLHLATTANAGSLRIVFAGDSITAANIYDGVVSSTSGGVAGFAPKLMNALPALYPEYTFHFWNEGVNGTKTSDWVNWVDLKITDHDPDIVVLMLGTNDAAQDVGISLTAFDTNLRGILSKIFAHNPATRIFLLTPPPVYEGKETWTRCNRLTASYAQKVRDVATELGGTVMLGETWRPISAHASDADYPDWWHPTDGIHPMQMGHNAIYNVVNDLFHGIISGVLVTSREP